MFKKITSNDPAIKLNNNKIIYDRYDFKWDEILDIKLINGRSPYLKFYLKNKKIKKFIFFSFKSFSIPLTFFKNDQEIVAHVKIFYESSTKKTLDIELGL